MRYHLQLCCLFFLTALILPASLLAENSEPVAPVRIVILHSYHKGLPWTDGQEDAIRKTLSRHPNCEIYTEYLNSKRRSLQDVSKQSAETLKAKFAEFPPAIVICTDNNALTFLRNHRKTLFTEAPVVFCGINNYKESMLDGFNGKITGIIQELNPTGTILLIHRLQPELQKLIIVSGITPTAQEIKKEVTKSLSTHSIPDHATVEWWDKLTTEKLLSRLRKLSNNDAILLCNFNRDADGKYYTHEKSAQMITGTSPAPVYAMEDQYIGTGVVGGYMNTAATQGSAAAKLALQILKTGKIPPVIIKCPNIIMFDYRAMKKNNLNTTLLPKNAVITDKPFSFYNTYQMEIITLSGFIVLLVIALILVSIHATRRRRSEMDLAITLKSIGDAVISTDKEENITRMNPVAEDLTGWKLADAKGKPLTTIFNILNADTRQPIANPAAQVMETGKVAGLANHTLLISKNGTEYQISDSAAPIRKEDGSITGVILVFRNVDEEYRMKIKMQSTEARYQTLLHNSLLGVLVAEIKTTSMRYANPAICKMLGYTKSELIKLTIEDIHPPDQIKFVFEEFHKQAKGENPLATNIPFMRKDGTIFIGDVSTSSAMFDGVKCNIGMIIDVTDKMKSEKILRDNEEKYRTLFENSGDAMLIIKKGRFVDCNKATVKMLEYNNKTEFLNKTPDELSPEFQPDGEISTEKAAKMLRIAFKNKSHTFEWTHKKKDGTPLPVEVSLTVIEFDGEKIIHTAWRDITQRKKAENELIKMQKLQSLGTLAGGIAHDFNNILLGIYGNISLARLELDSTSPAFSLLEDAEKSMNRATNLTNQLLTFSKGGDPAKEPIRLEDVVKNITEFTLTGSNIKSIIKKDKDLWYANADKGQIQQVISNLIINAKQAMPEGGYIYITLANVNNSNTHTSNLSKGEYIKITVIDEGTGIPLKYIENIFDPYFTTKQAGNGIGLATVYSIIQKHSGSIEVSSQQDKGSTFTIYLPAIPETKPKEQKNIDILATKNEDSAKVLIMDDAATLCDLLKKALTKQGYFTDIVNDGPAAIKKYQHAMERGAPFDVLCMDLTIPGGMGGVDTVKAILKINPKAKVIVFSGYSNDPVMANYKDYGFLGKLTKPFKLTELYLELDRVLNL